MFAHFRVVMAGSQNCPMPHDGDNGSPMLGISLITPSPNPRPLLDLLGVNDQELQEKMAEDHPYAFNMGNNYIIHFKDYKVATKALMKRNMADVLDNKQTEVIFLPETHLPTTPRVVDFQAYETKKKKLNKNPGNISDQS